MASSGSLDRIGSYVARRWAHLRTPGLALAVTDGRRCLGTIEHGLANLDAGRPVDASDRFQIGSISKGFTALAVLQEVERGRIELAAPLTRYLPWFEVRSSLPPIQIHHLLSHTSGLVTGTDFTAGAASEVWSLRDTWTGFAPGERFLYSNVAYKALGLVLEAVTGGPWWEMVRERVMRPIGMGDAEAVITNAARDRLVTGYGSPFDDRPWLPRHGWAASPWFESATADGTICASAEELTAYARLLLAGGAGVVSPGSFEAITRPVARDPQTGDLYGYGVKWLEDGEGRRLLGHAGGMVGFTAYLLVDVDRGFGVVTLMNSAFGRHVELARFALGCLAAEAAGDAMPEGPEPPDPLRVHDVEAYTGSYVDEESEVEVVVGRDGRPRLLAGGRAADLVTADEPDAFVVDDPALERFTIRFVREDGAVAGALWGPRRLRRDGQPGSPEPEPPAWWSGCAGRYGSWNPWAPGFRVFVRRGRLWLSFTGDASDADRERSLEPLEDGWFRVGEPWSPDRVRFDAVVDGRAQRAWFDAAPFYRTFAP